MIPHPLGYFTPWRRHVKRYLCEFANGVWLGDLTFLACATMLRRRRTLRSIKLELCLALARKDCAKLASIANFKWMSNCWIRPFKRISLWDGSHSPLSQPLAQP